MEMTKCTIATQN